MGLTNNEKVERLVSAAENVIEYQYNRDAIGAYYAIENLRRATLSLLPNQVRRARA